MTNTANDLHEDDDMEDEELIMDDYREEDEESDVGEDTDLSMVNPLGRDPTNASEAKTIAAARLQGAIAQRDKELREAMATHGCAVPVKVVNRYSAGWDSSVIFKGFAFKLQVREEPEVMRQMIKMGELTERMESELPEGEYVIDDEDSVIYVKSPGILLKWKMVDPTFLAKTFTEIEQHAD